MCAPIDISDKSNSWYLHMRKNISVGGRESTLRFTPCGRTEPILRMLVLS